MKEIITDLLLNVTRDGVVALTNWLNNETDFFTAPASTRFHGSFKGGLSEHSYNVYNCLKEIDLMPSFLQKRFDIESIILVSLLHDICKTNFYKTSMRNKKNEHGVWIQVPFYEVEDTHPYGHGECSVMLIEKFIKLTDEERYAIRWHMGGFDDSARGGSYAITKAFEKYPLALALHMADMMATYIMDKRSEEQ